MAEWLSFCAVWEIIHYLATLLQALVSWTNKILLIIGEYSEMIKTKIQLAKKKDS